MKLVKQLRQLLLCLYFWVKRKLFGMPTISKTQILQRFTRYLKETVDDLEQYLTDTQNGAGAYVSNVSRERQQLKYSIAGHDFIIIAENMFNHDPKQKMLFIQLDTFHIQPSIIDYPKVILKSIPTVHTEIFLNGNRHIKEVCTLNSEDIRLFSKKYLNTVVDYIMPAESTLTTEVYGY